jgi:hypothetical protein
MHKWENLGYVLYYNICISCFLDLIEHNQLFNGNVKGLSPLCISTGQPLENSPEVIHYSLLTAPQTKDQGVNIPLRNICNFYNVTDAL